MFYDMQKLAQSRKFHKLFERSPILSIKEVSGRGDVAMVLDKLPVPGRPNLDKSRARAVLLSSIFTLLFLPHFGRRPDID